jgi:glycosyltransferase involved in cell wall biosynthesis
MFRRNFEPSRPAPPAAAARRRALMVVESCGGGTGRHVADLSRGLVARGWEVHLLFSLGRVDNLFLDRLAGLDGVRCKPLPMRRGVHPSDLSVVRKARRYLRDEGPFHVVHGHSSKGGAVARLAAVGTGVPCFYTHHGFGADDPTMPRPKRLFYLAVERLLCPATSRVIAVSPEERRAAVRLGLGEARVVLVPNGVGASEAAPREQARATLGLAGRDLVVGFVGRFVPQKAPDVLLRAMARVVARVPGAKLAMVGDGPLRPELERLAGDLGVSERVLWLGERDARQLTAGFDVFAMPSRKEGLPYVVLEAMSAGLPVVGTDTAGLECLVTTGVNGAVVPCGDHEAMSTALVEILRDPTKRIRYGAASLARVADFTVDAMVDRTVAAYAGAMPDALPTPLSQPREEARASANETPDLDECEALAS